MSGAITILCSAIRTRDGKHILGKRHSDCLWIGHRLGLDVKNQVQGFLTSKHEFVTRKEAMEIAINAGQVSKEHRGTDLFSEQLY